MTTVAGPRRPYSKESYDGAELRLQCPRPGAYDAMKLPSVINGHLCAPIQREVFSNLARPSQPWPAVDSSDAHPLPTRTTFEQRAAKQRYTPKVGSYPAVALEYLHTHGGYITRVDLTRKLGVPKDGITAVFQRAVAKGALVWLKVDGRSAMSLPGYVHPVSATPSAETQRRQLEQRLERSKRALAKVQADVAEQQLRLRQLATAAD